MGQRDKSKALVDSVCGEIKSMNNTQAAIRRNKAELEAKCDRLLQELTASQESTANPWLIGRR